MGQWRESGSRQQSETGVVKRTKAGMEARSERLVVGLAILEEGQEDGDIV